jgi:cytochrome c-type biogenesis protein CcmH
VAIASSFLYYFLGSAPDVQINQQLKAISDQTTPEQMQDLMTSIELRSQQRPENLHYRAMLGRFYMGQQDYRRAAETYSALALDTPEDDQTLAYAAQADYLASNRELGDKAQMLAEQSLAINPRQRTALGLLGMASFEQGQYRAAIEYWERLIAMEPPGSEAAMMIAGIVERAREKLDEDRQQVTQAETEALVSPGVTIRVSLPAGAAINASDTVFVLARAANSDSRMPIAVQRLQGSDLPLVLRLDDSTSMAGQKLSETESIVVVVQVSPDGKPGEANATWLGNAGPLAPSLDTEPLEIILQLRN